MDQSQTMSMPVTSQSQHVMANQNAQLMNQLVNLSHMAVDQTQSQMMLNNGGGGYESWLPRKLHHLRFEDRNVNPSKHVRSSSTTRSNRNWKARKANDDRIYTNRKELEGRINNGSSLTNVDGSGKELQQRNRLKPRRYLSKKRFGKSAPYAPRNTTSFLIRAKKSGGIASLISPSPVTPAVLLTPIFSPSREVLIDTAKEQWGVDGYGSMKGLIRLRSPGNEEDDGTVSSESDGEEHLEVERRLNHDLSRFEMIYPNHGASDRNSYLLENRVDDQDTHISQLKEENLILKERLFFMEREFGNLRARLQALEMQRQGSQGFVEEVVPNESGNESGSRGYSRPSEENKDGLDENNVDSKECSNGEKNVGLTVEQMLIWKMVCRKSKKR